jgi:hypothetical protein
MGWNHSGWSRQDPHLNTASMNRLLMALGVLTKELTKGDGVQVATTSLLGLRIVIHGDSGSFKYAPQYSTRELGC